MNDDVTVLIVDDHPVVREGYRRLLERQPGFHVVADAENAADAYRLYKHHAPTLVLMDLNLPGPGGLEAVRHIRQWDRAARILVVSMHEGSAFVLKAFEAGALGYVSKVSGSRELLRAVKAVLADERAMSPDIADLMAAERVSAPASLLDALGPRETEILRLLAMGNTDEAIAQALNLSLKTVRNYHYEIKQKIGADNDAHLVWLAMRAGLVDPSSNDANASFLGGTKQIT
ncbi:response regulator transcription factor [Methylobacterium sp. 77]|uniref:response regulator n=1 Tax=Methylobacterium sp. 77 TaxID=1101192 RepID=UPI00035D64C1|nr:response regulator transcription factor [Methylobacterium sp. 77]